MNLNDTKAVKDKLDSLSLTDRGISLKLLNGILSELPVEYSELIEEAFKYKRIPKEYLLSSILFAVSSATGLTFYIRALGYKNYANLYFTIVGSRGDTKSEGLKLATLPLKEMDDQDYEEYIFEMKNFKSEVEEEPERKQLLIQNASIEAVHKIHSENPNSVGIYIDEVYALVEKMGNSNSRDGIAWRTFLLEGYTNSYVDIARKTSKSFRIKETYPTLLGGIQNEFVPKLFANGNLESGFVDRQLFMPKLTNNKTLHRGQMRSKLIEAYNTSIFNILAYKRQSEDPKEVKKQFEIELTNEAEERLFEYTQCLIDRQEMAKPVVKEYMSKMQISIHKFCILVHMMEISREMDYTRLLEIESVELAIKFNEFYFNNFKIIIDENLMVREKELSKEAVIRYAVKKNVPQKTVVDFLGESKGNVSKLYKKEREMRKLETSGGLKRTG